MYWDKKFLEFNFRGGQFYAESPKSKICITQETLGGPLAPGVGWDQKIVYYKMLLEFDFRWGMFYVKMPNSQKKNLGRVPARSGSNISGPTPKFKILLPTLFSPGLKVSKKVCYTSVRWKLREEIDFLETGRFRPRAVTFGPADLISPPKNYLREVGLVLIISSRSFHSIKSYSTF
jgi:hypothetical protein